MSKKNRRKLGVAAGGAVAGMFAAVAGAQQGSYTTGAYLQNFDVLRVTGLDGTQTLNTPTADGPFDLTLAPPSGIGAGAAMSGWYAGRITGGSAEIKLRTDDGAGTQASTGTLVSYGTTGA